MKMRFIIILLLLFLNSSGLAASEIPALRPYEINKDDDIWHAQDPSSYITPHSKLVQLYAQKRAAGEEGIVLEYFTDDQLHNFPANGDMWQNAEYTLFTKKGDCEDISIARVSVLRAAGLEAIVVGGILEMHDGTQINDFWYEFINEENIKITVFVSGNLIGEDIQFKAIPKYMFSDTIKWQKYRPGWHL